MAITASAEDLIKCDDNLEGLANPEIVRFGTARAQAAPRPQSFFSPVQNMANLMLGHVPAESPETVQIAMPVFLSVNSNQPQQFGDGQQNALATFGPLHSSPFAAVLTRKLSESSDLKVIISKDLPGYKDISAVEVSVLGKSENITLDQNGMFRISVNLEGLAWDQMFGAKPVFFRPVGWNDWFAVQFPYPYLSIENLFAGTTPTYQNLPDGKSIIDPLGLKGSKDIQTDLQQIKDSNNEGFLLARAERVHGIFWLTDDKNGPMVKTSNGGVWTRYRDELSTIGFKNVYLAKDPRVFQIEMDEGVVSGTGPHKIGASGEIIINSLGENPLMTFYGISTPTIGPDGHKLAYEYPNQWVGTWLKPGQAFVTPQGLYHWHLNHLPGQIAAQVLTPPEVPSEQNHFGFPKK